MWKKLILAVGLVVVHFFYTKKEIKDAKDVVKKPTETEPVGNVTPLTPPSSA